MVGHPELSARMLVGPLQEDPTAAVFVCLFVFNPTDEETAAAFDFQSRFQSRLLWNIR